MPSNKKDYHHPGHMLPTAIPQTQKSGESVHFEMHVWIVAKPQFIRLFPEITRRLCDPGLLPRGSKK
jgi:hypothetical protein